MQFIIYNTVSNMEMFVECLKKKKSSMNDDVTLTNRMVVENIVYRKTDERELEKKTDMLEIL